MAKKILPIYLDVKDRRILQAIADLHDCSMGEAARRCIRNFKIEVVQEGAPRSGPLLLTESTEAPNHREGRKRRHELDEVG